MIHLQKRQAWVRVMSSTPINGTKVENLRTYSNILKKFAPGDVIDVTFTQEGQQQTVKLTLKAR